MLISNLSAVPSVTVLATGVIVYVGCPTISLIVIAPVVNTAVPPLVRLIDAVNVSAGVSVT